MYSLDECGFVIEWTSLSLSAVSRVTFKPEWETRENHNEVNVKTPEQAKQFYELIPEAFKPRLWLEASDKTRLLVRSSVDSAAS